ncbi:MAG TPA: hypothetical protein P5337_07585 [Aestuariivirga sp.]|nr:hypothetical protein [Aestuariivirga sp.]
MNAQSKYTQGRPLPLEGETPVLHLSGPALTLALEAATTGAEALGGIERYVTAVALKAKLFQDALGDGKASSIELDALMGLCTFMSSVRRRIAPYLDTAGLDTIRKGFAILFDGANDTTTTDQRMEAFERLFPQDRKHSFVRDLAAEALHYTMPELYPLMCRWVWDAGTNTGALREMWFGDEVDHMMIDVPDTYATFLVLRQELSQFLTANGIYRDMLYYSDVLCAQVYSHYICAQGGSYLRADFSSPQDPMQYTRRLLGLDGVEPRSGKTRLKSIDGSAFVLDDVKLLG